MNSKLPNVFGRLDEAYACWEESMWKKRMTRRISELFNPSYEPRISEIGFPVDGANETKRLLLESVSRDNPDYLLPSFLSSVKSKELPTLNELEKINNAGSVEEKRKLLTEEKEVGTLWEKFHFPYYLGKWNSCSRRIYYVPTDLMLMLEVTKISDLTLKSIRLPFSSFAIALEEPLVTESKQELDFFLIGELSEKCLAVYGLSRTLSKRKPLDYSLRAKIEDAAKKNNLQRLARVGAKEMIRLSEIDEYWDAFIFDEIEATDADYDLEIALSELSDSSENPWIEKFFRVLIGMCAYLSMFNAANDASSDIIQEMAYVKKVYPGFKDGPALIEEANVLRVQSVIKLSSEERGIIREQLSSHGGWEVRSHFREGHWRRPPGEGNNPNAKKTIWVRPTLVRRDRLPENALPLGAQKII